MKLNFFVTVLACLVLTRDAEGQGTAFTYQGRLADGSSPAIGIYDISFSLFDAASFGSQVGGVLTNSAVAMTNGLFAVPLDFGGGIFDGSARWLQISVRTNGGGTFSLLSPRQQLTATPYAVTASNLSGTLPAAQLSGTLGGSALNGIYPGVVTFSNPGNSFSGSNISAQTITVTNTGSFGSLAIRANLQFGTNDGYVATFPSVSGLLGPTNLGFNFNRSSTLWDVDKPPDEVMMWGYNISPGGGLADFHDSALGFSLEGNYNTGGDEYTEAHLLYVDKIGNQWRPWSWRINKSTTYSDWQQLIHASKLSVLNTTNDLVEYLSLTPDQFIYRLAPGYTNGLKIYEIGGNTPGIQLLPAGGAANPQLWIASWDQVVTPVGTMKQTSFDINQSVNMVNKPFKVQDSLGNDVTRLDPNGLTLSTNTSIRFLFGPNIYSSLSAQISSTKIGVISAGPNLDVGSGLNVGGVAQFGSAVSYSFAAQSASSSSTNFIADFAVNYRTLMATNSVNFSHATNLPTAGTNVVWSVIKIVASGSARNFSAPTNWHWMVTGSLSVAGGVYTGTVPSGKRAWLSLYADGGSQDDVSASWVLEP